MSGPGTPDRDSSSNGTPPPSKATPDSCFRLTGKRLLASPNPAALVNLIKDKVLDVSYNGTSLDILDGAVKCGTVISDVGDFIDCIAIGHEYVAVVYEISTARCVLEIRIK